MRPDWEAAKQTELWKRIMGTASMARVLGECRKVWVASDGRDIYRGVSKEEAVRNAYFAEVCRT